MQILIFEKRPRWTPQLQRQFVGDESVRVRSCDLEDIQGLLQGGESIVAVLDLEAGAAACLQFLGRMHRRQEVATVLVVGTHETRMLEWAIRELGAVDFAWGHISAEGLAVWCRRQAAANLVMNLVPAARGGV